MQTSEYDRWPITYPNIFTHYILQSSKENTDGLAQDWETPSHWSYCSIALSHRYVPYGVIENMISLLYERDRELQAIVSTMVAKDFWRNMTGNKKNYPHKTLILQHNWMNDIANDALHTLAPLIMNRFR